MSVAIICGLCDAILVGKGRDDATISDLDRIAKDLAVDESLRIQTGASDPSIWPGFHKAWGALATQAAVGADEDDVPTRRLVTSFARFTRNLVAAVPSNQQNAFTSEPSLRRILHIYSSWTSTQDPLSYPATRILVQTLSNIVTSNDDIMNRLWNTYLNLPEEQVVFVRLLGSPDARTVLSLLVLLVNCTYESDHRRELLAETQVGARLCIALLDRMVTLYDTEESSDEGKAFDFMYNLFAHLFDGGFAPKLYANLKVPDEIIAPHQTTLLKLLDSYIHSSHASTALVGMCPMLTACFFEFCTFSIHSIRKFIGSGNVAGVDIRTEHNSFDLLLPKVCEALVLVTQCLVSTMLEFQEKFIGERSEHEMLLRIRGSVSSSGQEIEVCTVELLRLLDSFLPRINFGKPLSPPIPSIPAVTDPTAFSYVKRDLVRLLGVLCYKDRKIQDSIRTSGGIIVVMNMCVVDERNPYLREHAIFTLHNLLEGNKENQKVVDNIQPSERLGQGVLQK